MANPTITNNDPRGLVLFNGIYRDAQVKRGAAGTLLKGTILAFDETTNTYLPTQIPGTAGLDDNAKAIMPADLVFAGTETKNYRLLVGGEVDENLLVFFDGASTADTVVTGTGDTIRTQLRAYGINLNDVTDDSVLDNQ